MIHAIDRYSKKLKRKIPSFNLKLWKHGFSTCEVIEDKDRVSTYVLKYITKELVLQAHKKNYFSSRNLMTPIVINNVEIDCSINDVEIYEFMIVYKFGSDIVDYI